MSRKAIQLDQLSQLAELFRLFSNGRHLNRVSDPALWAELERAETDYCDLFKALGYELRIDGRGFAWFHNEEASNTVNKASRQLALLFMVIFDTQADAGKPLLRFGDWIIDRALLATVYEQHQELLTAEELDIDTLSGLLETASRFGFARTDSSGRWQLLPAVCRYLDHFEALAAERNDSSRAGYAFDPEEGPEEKNTGI
ncbi:MAG: hypothetical protein R3F53_19405 [Gammaproteobacteria bacterium]